MVHHFEGMFSIIIVEFWGMLSHEDVSQQQSNVVLFFIFHCGLFLNTVYNFGTMEIPTMSVAQCSHGEQLDPSKTGNNLLLASNHISWGTYNSVTDFDTHLY